MTKKLLDEISIQELREMREIEGLSNGEIAERLGVSCSTIYKHIGGHPNGVRKKRSTPTGAVPGSRYPDRTVICSRGGEHSVCVQPDEPQEACLFVQNSIVELVSAERTYVVDMKDATVELMNGFKIELAQLDSLIKELSAIKRKLGSSVRVPLEAW